MEDGGGKGWRGRLFHSIGVPQSKVQTLEKGKEWLFNISCLRCWFLYIPVSIQGQPGPSQRLEESKTA